MTRRRWQALAIIGAWTLVALVAASQRHYFLAGAGRPAPFTDSLWGALESCSIWAAFTPAILWLSRRLRIQRRDLWRSLLAHAGLGVSFAMLDAVLDVAIGRILGLEPQHSVGATFVANSFINLVSYFAVVAIGHAVQYHALYVERELAASRLEAQLLGAQVRALAMQLRPHFLFNTLHAVASLVRAGRNPEAVRMIAGLSDLLRASLRGGGPAEVPLREELEFVERYLAIERIRFQDRLETRVSVEPEALEALVPPLILQPLVENAILHGIERRSAPGRVEVAAERRNGTLVLRVEDSSARPSA
ncbi:MAG TPA: histidine kinase, partial [Gemmatimonadales bacterium]|nr:histidine kinase [Gemmatimonadales bacterium]